MVYETRYSEAVAEIKRLKEEVNQCANKASIASISRKADLESSIDANKIIKNICKSRRGGMAMDSFLSFGGQIIITNLSQQESPGKPDSTQPATYDHRQNIIFIDPTDLTPQEKTAQVAHCLCMFDNDQENVDFVKAVQRDIAQHDRWKDMLRNKAEIEEKSPVTIGEGYKTGRFIGASFFKAPELN